jgi:hypothetical protein
MAAKGPMAARTVGRITEGSLSRISTVDGPLASTASTVLKMALPLDEIAPQRRSEATTSAAPSSFPLWKRTPLGEPG